MARAANAESGRARRGQSWAPQGRAWERLRGVGPLKRGTRWYRDDANGTCNVCTGMVHDIATRCQKKNGLRRRVGPSQTVNFTCKPHSKDAAESAAAVGPVVEELFYVRAIQAAIVVDIGSHLSTLPINEEGFDVRTVNAAIVVVICATEGDKAG